MKTIDFCSVQRGQQNLISHVYMKKKIQKYLPVCFEKLKNPLRNRGFGFKCYTNCAPC
jgi:hypothetical protein